MLAQQLLLPRVRQFMHNEVLDTTQKIFRAAMCQHQTAAF
jgi:hypothetical protein